MQVRFPYVRTYRDRHGKQRIEYRRNGRIIPLRAVPGTAEFQAAYDEAKQQFEPDYNVPEGRVAAGGPPIHGTYRWLCTQYFGSTDFKQLDPDTQRARRLILEGTCRERWSPGADRLFGDAPIKSMSAQALAVLRDRKADKPEAARARLKAISRVFDWAVEARIEGVARNPARDVRYPKPKAGGGFHSWTLAELAQYEREIGKSCEEDAGQARRRAR